MFDRVSPKELKARLNAGGELALLDLREAGTFQQAHLFHARSIPLSRLELLILDAVPRKAAPIILVDGADDGPATRGAEILESAGYCDIAILEGGVKAWDAAGLEIFSGVNVPSKAFGELVEQRYETPHLEAAEVKALIDAGRNMVILDSRPYEEYHNMSIPTGIDSPGAELVHRVFDAAPDPETLVVVNCAGRTRSIIGTQSLVNAGIPNPVAALKDGTMGWQLAGLGLNHGATEMAARPSETGLAKSQAAAVRVAERFGVKRITMAELQSWRDEAGERTLYIIDVRSPEEYEAGHLTDARPVAGGQLVQESDQHIAVLGARVVLVDDNEVRATMTASWLIQLGWSDVAVLAGGLGGEDLVQEPRVIETLIGVEALREEVSALELKAILDSGEPVVVLDLRTSRDYRKGHIPGAAWGLRGRFDVLKSAFLQFGLVIVCCDDDEVLNLALPELAAAMPEKFLRVLSGGLESWVAADLPLETGDSWLLSETDDVWYRPYEDESAREEAMRGYLVWEVGLIAQVERDGDANFRWFDA